MGVISLPAVFQYPSWRALAGAGRQPLVIDAPPSRCHSAIIVYIVLPIRHSRSHSRSHRQSHGAVTLVIDDRSWSRSCGRMKRSQGVAANAIIPVDKCNVGQLIGISFWQVASPSRPSVCCHSAVPVGPPVLLFLLPT